MEAAQQQHGNGRQRGGNAGSAREAAAVHLWRWRRRWQLSGGGQWGSRRWQSGGSGGSTATELAARWRRWQRSGSIGRSGIAAARQKQAAWRRHLQRGVSGGSTVAVLAERQRQHGGGAMTAGSTAEPLPAKGQQRQRSRSTDNSPPPKNVRRLIFEYVDCKKGTFFFKLTNC